MRKRWRRDHSCATTESLQLLFIIVCRIYTLYRCAISAVEHIRDLAEEEPQAPEGYEFDYTGAREDTWINFFGERNEDDRGDDDIGERDLDELRRRHALTMAPPCSLQEVAGEPLGQEARDATMEGLREKGERARRRPAHRGGQPEVVGAVRAGVNTAGNTNKVCSGMVHSDQHMIVTRTTWPSTTPRRCWGGGSAVTNTQREFVENVNEMMKECESSPTKDIECWDEALKGRRRRVRAADDLERGACAHTHTHCRRCM